MDIKGFCERSGKTKKEIAQALGVSSPTISSWSKGKNPSFDVIRKMFLLGFTIREIFGDDVSNANEKAEINERERIMASVPQAFNTPEFKAGVAQAIKDMKEKGYL